MVGLDSLGAHRVGQDDQDSSDDGATTPFDSSSDSTPASDDGQGELDAASMMDDASAVDSSDANAALDAASPQGGGGDFSPSGGGVDTSSPIVPNMPSMPVPPVPPVSPPAPTPPPSDPGSGPPTSDPSAARAKPSWMYQPGPSSPANSGPSGPSLLQTGKVSQPFVVDFSAPAAAQSAPVAQQIAQPLAMPMQQFVADVHPAALQAQPMAMFQASAAKAAPVAMPAAAPKFAASKAAVMPHAAFALHGLHPILGAMADSVTDYDYGEKQVLQLVQFFNAMGRPKDFEADVEAVYRSYESSKISPSVPYNMTAGFKWSNATAMKQVGADASAMMDKLQQAYPGKAATVPSGRGSSVYEPGTDKPFEWPSVPTWLWLVGGGVAIVGIGWLAVPIVLPLLASVRHRARA